ncbi:MAG: glycoside hydrolase family 38 C-terminal domain-containing protein, partial [Gemmiger sp.]|nr:glycoside hydrolase family 38 C-terminal domain-containing protein [Gemmiger sp.]
GWRRDCGYLPEAYGTGQAVETIAGERCRYAEGLAIDAFSVQTLSPHAADEKAPSPFSYDGTCLETPYYRLRFAQNGALDSIYEKTAARELRRSAGMPLNSFILSEDVPQAWDNWDIDADVVATLHPLDSGFIRRTVTADGALQFRLRSVFALSEKSTLTQDIVVYANRRKIDFETKVDWHETHKLLKAGFDLDINAAKLRHEIQFGYTERAAFKNNCYEKAMFEVLNHKYTDMSELRFGAALLNDCKYGISVDGTLLALTLLKSGTHPDPTADEGTHLFTYSLVTHDGFSFENVIRPAYELNYPLLALTGAAPRPSFVMSSRPNAIIDTIKIAEDGTGLVLRVYESEGTATHSLLHFTKAVKQVYRTNLLEQNPVALAPEENTVALTLKAFEIATLKVLF